LLEIQEVYIVSKDRILVVEDAPDISSLLKIYFVSQGYEVFTAMRGRDALDICRKTPPSLALLDVNLPDMEGYDIGKSLRSSPRTRHIPIIFLTARGERQDRLKGLGEVQAQYYIVKPFDIEEVHTIVKNQLEEARRKNQSHPVTNLPTADIINEHLRTLLTAESWSLALVHVNGFETFTQSYGSVVSEDVLKFTAMLLNEAINELGSEEDFLGHMVVGPDFIITSLADNLHAICERLIARFDEEIGLHYNYKHRRQGFIEIIDDEGNTRQIPLMSLSIGVLTEQDGPFYDIRELSETAEETRQRAASIAREQGKKSLVHYGRAKPAS
jgi:DNA-binding response OmpR family regulator/predicted metal-dependent hydrolase